MAGTTALLKSAASIRDQLATYQDSVKAFEFGNSAYTDSALSDYSAYLQDRIKSLSGTGSISDASKALSLTKSLDSATKSNISATITRENINMMAGGASLTDKYNVIVGQYTRASANGDMTLAQSLMGQAYSTYQTIQLQAQEAQNAAITQTNAAAALAKTTNSKNAKLQADVASTLQDKLAEFNTNYANAGRKSADKVLNDFVKSMAPTFKTLGIVLQPGSKPNYFDIVTGANNAVITAYKNAYTINAPTADDGGQSYIDKGVTAAGKIPTIYGNMNQSQLTAAANNPNQFSYREDPQFVTSKQGGTGGTQNQQIGYSMGKNGNISPTFASSPWIQIPTSLNNQIQALHLNVVGSGKVSNGVEVHASNESPQWVKNIIGNASGNATTHIVSDAQGNLQLEADGINGQGKSIYTITKDNKVWETTQDKGNWLINTTGSMNGHSMTNPQNEHAFGFQNFKNNMSNWFGGLVGHGNGSDMLSGATNNYQATPMPLAAMPQLPAIAMPAATSQGSISTVPVYNQPVNPFPVQIQAPRANIQGSAPIVQGGAGSGINQSGGSGVKITGTTNAPVGMRI